MTQRWKLTIEYDGTQFVGWQVQENGISVQGCLEKAIHAFCGETVTIAGRELLDRSDHWDWDLAGPCERRAMTLVYQSQLGER